MIKQQYIQYWKRIIIKLLNKYETIMLDDVDYGYDAPTDTGIEVQIDLFPKDYGAYDTIEKYKNKYYHECQELYQDIKKYTQYYTQCDIDWLNSWNFVYIIL